MRFSRLISLVVSALFTTHALATDVGGPIVTDTTWTLAGSPYIVINAIIVGGSATLTIDPGVTVKFNAGLGITVGSQAWGIGTVKAIGTASQKITFTSNTNPGQPGQWKDIFFTDRSIDAAFDGNGQYLSGSTLQHCIVEYAGGGASGSGAVTISQSSPFINFCEIRNNARSGVYANNTTTPPLAPPLQIKNSHIHHNSPGSSQVGGGATLSITGLAFIGNTVSNNTANNNQGGGVYAIMSGSSSTFTFAGNTISNNTATNGTGGGMVAYMYGSSCTFTFADNLISNNTAINAGGIYVNAGGGSGNTNTLSGNTISSNTATDGAGGGMYVVSQSNVLITIQYNSVFGNLAQQGGGISLANVSGGLAQANLTGNTFAANRVGSISTGNGYGGGIHISNNSNGNGLVVNLASNRITDNIADGGPTGGTGLGGGLYVSESQAVYSTTINLTGDQSAGAFNVLSGNTADFGDAIFNDMLYDENGTNDIQAGYVCWGGLDPNPTVSPNLIYDFFDNPQKSFVIYPPHVSGPNCAPAPGCGPGLIRDCNGNCAPVSWIGDGYCDNGFYTYNGVPIYFNCQQFGNDGGDCNSPPPPIMNPPNHGVQEPAVPYDPQTPPTPVQDKLIVVVHGWNTDFDTYATFWAPLRNVIRANVGPDWKVESYDWTSDSGSLNPLFGPDYALVTGAIHGAQYGETVALLGYTHVHLIAHSAGSAFIANAARRIRELSPNTTIHTTYLDAYAGAFPGFTDYLRAYGRDSDWSDYYYSQEPLDVCFGGGTCLGTYVATGPYTEQYLPNSFNLDISHVDPDFNEPFCPLVSESLSSHGWPPRFYRYTVDGNMLNGCEPPNGIIVPYGFPLSYEQWTGQGGFAAWKAERLDAYPTGAVRSLPEGLSGASMAFHPRGDPPIDLGATPSFPSSPEAVQTVAGVLSMTTQPPGAPEPSPAWINFQITTTIPVNFISFDMTFTGDPGAAGLVTLYVNGTKRGVVDEPYALPGPQHYALPTPGELAPGEHFLSFRLDHFNALTSTITIENVATGFGEFVPACPADFNDDGTVSSQDFFDFITAFFAGNADFNGDAITNSQDFFDFLAAFFVGC